MPGASGYPSGVSDGKPDCADIDERLITELRQIVAALETQIELSDHAHGVVVSALANAMLAGARVAVAEAMVRAVREDANIDLHLHIGPEELADAAE
jgi:hypothetical protein